VASDPPLLPIHDMASRHTGLTTPLAQAYLEAARVCLDRFHASPVPFEIEGPSKMDTTVVWQAADDRIAQAWANEDDTTECGAYACALAAIELAEGLVAIRRAETRTGADYYVNEPGTTRDDLEGSVRFEISGVSGGTQAAVSERLRNKLAQAARGDSNLPAMAGVVGFRAQHIAMARLGEA